MEKFKNLNKKFYDKLVDQIKTDVPDEEVAKMFEKYNPASIRNGLEEASAIYAGNKDIRDFYEQPELFKNVSIKEQPNMIDPGRYNFHVDPKTGLYVPESKSKILLKDKGDLATLGHEFQHHYDEASRPLVKVADDLTDSEALKMIKKEKPDLKQLTDLKGLKDAALYYKDHFKPDPEFGAGQLKQFLNLKRMIKGNPLKMVAPIAIGAAALGIGEKAYAGDTKGATQDALSMITPDLLASDNLNSNEQELLKQQENEFQQQPDIRRFEKIRKIMQGQQ